MNGKFNYVMVINLWYVWVVTHPAVPLKISRIRLSSVLAVILVDASQELPI